jgi:hypothetical protein
MGIGGWILSRSEKEILSTTPQCGRAGEKLTADELRRISSDEVLDSWPKGRGGSSWSSSPPAGNRPLPTLLALCNACHS